ncbi:MAG: DUF2520 domain-containing protein [Bacteroidales bacterium]|nr:DUF2520 domain-containing protein [Bacteroidales bacterium]MBN2819050.1 DUF2520 domain-containing protein [Bacteroidales bacterium]
MEFKKGITIIGTGNVAWHIAHKFYASGIQINLVVGRNEQKGKVLAKGVNSKYSVDFSDIPFDTDLVLICITDSAISSVAEKISSDISIAHTAGSVPLSVLGNKNKNTGVFYPFQTFSYGVRTGEIEIPICIEANSTEMNILLNSLAKKINSKIYPVNSDKRKLIHLAGVVANNFSNFLYTQAFEFLKEEDIKPEILLPLIKETTAKLEVSEPSELQTGPARRRNSEVINCHKELLRGNKQLKELYSFMSDLILAYYKNKDE